MRMREVATEARSCTSKNLKAKPGVSEKVHAGIQAPSALARDHRLVMCKGKGEGWTGWGGGVGGGTNLKQNAFFCLFFVFV